MWKGSYYVFKKKGGHQWDGSFSRNIEYNKGFIGHDIYENYEENKQRKRYGNSYEQKPKNSQLLYQNTNKILNEN